MAYNRVTPNILMLVCLLGGLYMATQIKQEVFPDFASDEVQVRVRYPGASPEEVEQGILLVVEEAIRGLDGIDEVTATAGEGSGTITAEIIAGYDQQELFQRVQQEITRITTFPDDAEEPEVALSLRRRDVLDIEVFGNVPEHVLRESAEIIRDRLIQADGITQVDLDDVRDFEVHVEIPQENLRRYNLTMQDVVSKLRSSSVEIPGGKIETSGGELLLRVDERRDYAMQFARIPIIVTESGTTLYLEDLGKVRETFEDTDDSTYYNSAPSIGLDVYRVGKETPIGVSDAAKEALEGVDAELPPGVEYVIRRDDSDSYRDRRDLLLKNMGMGLVVVLVLLSLFLEFKLAFWVMMGIPISFMGTFLFLPLLGVSINMISMFAFIIALGIVVDDAIVAGENIYEYRQKGMALIPAAVQGAKDVALPVTFSILTNIIAFLPLYFVPGIIGKIWKVTPLVVCTVFLISLVEALFILPAHLGHTSDKSKTSVGRWLHDKQQGFSRLFVRGVENLFGPVLALCLRARYLTLAVGLSILMLSFAMIASNRLGFVPFPRTESDSANVTATLPFGSPMEDAERVREHLKAAAERVVAANGGKLLSDGIVSRVRENDVRIEVFLTDPATRPISTAQMTEQWRKQAGALPGLETLKFESDRGGPGSGAALTVELSHRDVETLNRASSVLADRLSEYPVFKDIDDGYAAGKRQFDFSVTEAGESLGIDAAWLSQQLRNRFQGAEAIKQQRGRDELTVRVRLPEDERTSVYNLETMIIRTPGGGEVPLSDVASVEVGRAYTSINRREGARTSNVTADINPIGESGRMKAEVENVLLPQLMQDFPGLSAGFEGRQAEFAESFESLKSNFLIALIIIYILLAIPFRSYTQPIIVMFAIPFGLVGAVLGHMIMGYNLSIISVMGIIALSGIVVNDSLVLIDYCNTLVRKGGVSPAQAIYQAGIRRFRPILLTTLTTFGGLAPMIFETSRQAQFMIPMAISLGFGILFATFIIVIIVPCTYLVLDDIRRFFTFPSADEPRPAPIGPIPPDTLSA